MAAAQPRRVPRYLTATFLVLVAALPGTWYVAARTQLGVIRPYHVVAGAFVTVALFQRRSRAVLLTARALPGPWVSAGYWIGLLGIGVWYHAAPVADVAQQIIYLWVALTSAAYVAAVSLAEDRGWHLRRLQWAGLVGTIGFLTLFWLSARGVGIDIVGVLRRAITTADPGVLQFQLFRAAFASGGFEDTARANFRHAVFGGVLVSLWIGVWARSQLPRPQPPVARIVWWLSTAVGSLLLFLSLSRSVILAGLLGLAGLAIVPMRTGRLNPRDVVVVVAVVGTTLLAIFTGLAGLVWRRFTVDRASYSGRGESLAGALDSIGDAVLLGGAEVNSPHNIVLDSWLSAGVFAAAAAATLFCILAWHALRALYMAASHQSPWQVAAVGLVFLPLVRMMTAGGGLLVLTEWLAVGIFLGALVGEAERRGIGHDPRGTDRFGASPLSHGSKRERIYV